MRAAKRVSVAAISGSVSGVSSHASRRRLRSTATRPASRKRVAKLPAEFQPRIAGPQHAVTAVDAMMPSVISRKRLSPISHRAGGALHRVADDDEHRERGEEKCIGIQVSAEHHRAERRHHEDGEDHHRRLAREIADEGDAQNRAHKRADRAQHGLFDDRAHVLRDHQHDDREEAPRRIRQAQPQRAREGKHSRPGPS